MEEPQDATYMSRGRAVYAPEPRLDAKGEIEATIYGPDGKVLKVIKPQRVRFGFQPST